MTRQVRRRLIREKTTTLSQLKKAASFYNPDITSLSADEKKLLQKGQYRDKELQMEFDKQRWFLSAILKLESELIHLKSAKEIR